MVTFRKPRTNPRDNMLAVWTNGERVGTWFIADREHRFQYQESWQASPAGRRLSLSLPFTPDNVPHRGDVVRNFFDNLLPDSAAIRRRVAEKFSGGSADTFDLLAAIGRDCVGSVQLLPVDEEPKDFDQINANPLDTAGVEAAIDNAISGARALGQLQTDDFRISIAGAQEKTALLNHDGQWCMPLGSTPTTHIFKLPIGLVGHMRADMQTSVENEWLSSKLLGMLRFPVAPTDIATFGKHKVLVVERFDRALESPPGRQPWIARIPQEDLCQALGVPSDLKYESDGGPGHRTILRLLDTSSRAMQDKLTFVKTQLAFWLMAATDGHAKNFSIFLERGGGYRLTPLYDVLSAWPIIGNGGNMLNYRRAKLSMALRSKNAHHSMFEIQTRHWELLAKQCGVPGAFDEMVAMVLLVPQVLQEAEALLPKNFPRQVFTSIRRGMQAQAELFVRGMP